MGSRIGVSPLPTHRKASSVSEASIASDVHETLDVHGRLGPQHTLDLVVALDLSAQTIHIVVVQILSTTASVDLARLDDLPRAGITDTVDICERDHDPLADALRSADDSPLGARDWRVEGPEERGRYDARLFEALAHCVALECFHVEGHVRKFGHAEKLARSASVTQAATMKSSRSRKPMRDRSLRIAARGRAPATDTTIGRPLTISQRRSGGTTGAPKFPSNLPLRLLLRQHRRTGDARALDMARLTLTKMARSGMYDQIGGGFHRYATDAAWLVPHFEKMLYDNALLAIAYLEAYQVTGDESYADVVRDVLRYVAREMTDPANLRARFIEAGCWIRPFGKIVYLMPAFTIGEDDLWRLTETVVKVLGDWSRNP